MSTELRRLFPKKERRVSDLLEFVKTRTSQVPNYTLLLGAGASATSGIRTAAELISIWLKEHYCAQSKPTAPYSEDVARKYLSQHHADWYSAEQEYASLFKRKFDLPRQRRTFVEAEVAGKMPSMGYAYLIRLIEHRFFRTIFTPNFDDLPNEAFHQHSQLRPMICSHDSSISSITVTSDGPKIIKLHGDYLFDDIKTTIGETAALGHNTGNKFAEFCKNQGQIVVGYSGRDYSIMSVLQQLAGQEDYFKHGLYWCTRRGDTPSPELTELLDRARVYWVEIEGFDELMAELHRYCIGNEVPINTAAVSEKPWEMITRFCNDAALRRSTSRIIQEDLACLRRELEHERLVESTRSIFRDEMGAYCDTLSLSDRQRVQLMALRRDLRARKIDAVLQRVSSLLSESPSDAFRENLLTIRIHAENSLGRVDDALHTCDELIEQNPGEVGHLLLRAETEPTIEKRLATFSRAIEIDPSNCRPFGLRAELRKSQLNEDPHCDVEATAARVLHDYQEAIERHPCIANPFWSSYFHFLLKPKTPVANQRELLDDILRRLRRMNPFHTTYLALRVDYARRMEGPEGARQTIAEIRAAATRIQSRSNSRHIRTLLLRALRALGYIDELLEEAAACDTDEELQTYGDYVEVRAEILAHVEGKLSAAIDLLRANKRSSNKASTAEHLINYLGYAERVPEAQAVLREFWPFLTADERHDMESSICSLLGDHAGALEHTRQRRRRALFPAALMMAETHDLLKVKSFAEVESVSRQAVNAPHLKYVHEITINHELARIGQGHPADIARLERVLAQSQSDLTCMCAHLLAGHKDRAAERLLKAMCADKTVVHEIRGWAIFDSEELRDWRDATLQSRDYLVKVSG